MPAIFRSPYGVSVIMSPTLRKDTKGEIYSYGLVHRIIIRVLIIDELKQVFDGMEVHVELGVIRLKFPILNHIGMVLWLVASIR